MAYFEELYNDRSARELEELRPSEKGKIVTRKERLSRWIKTCLKGAIEANEQSLGRLEEELVGLRARLANGDDSVIRQIMQNRFMSEETAKQGPFLKAEYKEAFGEDL